jgi:hypothetical protein
MTARRLVLAVLAATALAAPAAAKGLAVSTFGAAWSLAGTDLKVWSNSAEAGLVIDNRGQRGFLTLNAHWDNIMAGSFVSTPEGVVVGTSRDGSPITGALALQPAERQSWTLRPNVTGAYRFAVVGGTRASAPGQATYGVISRDMAAKGVSFAMHLGNAVTDGNKRQLELFREQLGSFAFPTYVVPGNHEVAKGGRKDWQRLFGTMPVSFKIGPDRFIMLDNATGALDRRQENWLIGMLGRATDEKARHVFVFLHKPVVDVRPGLNQGMRDLPQARRLLKYFREHDVHTVFAGHIPMYARERRQDVDYVTTAGGGERLVVAPARGGYHHWLRVDVDAAGKVDVAPVRVNAPR